MSNEADLTQISNKQLVDIIKRANNSHTKVYVSMSASIGDYRRFTVLELAQELAERFPLSREVQS